MNAANLLSFKKSLCLFWVGFCYSAQHPGVKTRCRADLIPACFAQMGPAGIKNWAAKNLWEVLVKSGWWFLLGIDTHQICLSIAGQVLFFNERSKAKDQYDKFVKNLYQSTWRKTRPRARRALFCWHPNPLKLSSDAVSNTSANHRLYGKLKRWEIIDQCSQVTVAANGKSTRLPCCLINLLDEFFVDLLGAG